MADVLAGMAIGGTLVAITFGRISSEHISFGELLITNNTLQPLRPILLLLAATVGLYGGGVVLNDVFDADLDRIERPERPIPSGVITKSSAAIFGASLLLFGILAAALSDPEIFFSASMLIAAIIAIAAVIYDKWTKHNAFFGPLNMGICRGLNLLLGMSIISFSIARFWYVALIPVVYIAAITMVSRGEVHGGRKNTMYFAGLLYLLAITSILIIAYSSDALVITIPFLVILALMIFIPLKNAINDPKGPLIGKAVKGGVLGLIAMDAAIAAAFGDLFFAIVIILLLPLSFLLARMFAVT